MSTLAGTVVSVTGGGSGIGEAGAHLRIAPVTNVMREAEIAA